MNNVKDFSLRQAIINDIPAIWDIIYFAKENMRIAGRTQWQDGYPSIDNIRADIRNDYGYVLTNQCNDILCYGAILPHNDEHYHTLEGGKWITDGSSCIVIHRLAVNPSLSGKGLATAFITLAEETFHKLGFKSLRIDTNFDNPQMLHIVEKLNFTKCGKVTLPTGERTAFETILGKNL